MSNNFQSRVSGFSSKLMQAPQAAAFIEGSEKYPQIKGIVRFHQTKLGVLVLAEVNGLPSSENTCNNPVFGFHLHSGNHCDSETHEPFSEAMGHYNPDECPHPFHAGDFPPLFGNCGYAFSTFLTNRFSLSEIIGKALIIHAAPDDFTSQPAGNSGERIACGIIMMCNNTCRRSAFNQNCTDPFNSDKQSRR